MKNIKKISFLLIFPLLIIGLSACSSNTINNSNVENESNNESNTDILNNESLKENISEDDLSNAELGGINEGINIESDNKIEEETIENNKLNNENKVLESEITNSTSELNINNNMIDPNNFEDLVSSYTGAIVKTNKGEITVKLYNAESPQTVNNFLNLAKADFYTGTKFHRIISDFMIQGGDPLSKEEDKMYYGTGGPGYKFNDEINNKKLVRGSLAMANSGPNTNGSQFFIVTAEETPWLDGAHTNFGQVVSGMEVVELIEGVKTGARDIPEENIIIKSIELIK